MRKRDFLFFTLGTLVLFLALNLIAAKKETPLERCEYERSVCEQELDECIALQR